MTGLYKKNKKKHLNLCLKCCVKYKNFVNSGDVKNMIKNYSPILYYIYNIIVTTICEK